MLIWWILILFIAWIIFFIKGIKWYTVKFDNKKIDNSIVELLLDTRADVVLLIWIVLIVSSIALYIIM